jgi:hypothetical protein
MYRAKRTALTFPDLSPMTRRSGAGPDSLWQAHKVPFCRTLLDTFDPYKPAVIDGRSSTRKRGAHHRLADLGHRGADREQGRIECALTPRH